jgi:hypothetical protein
MDERESRPLADRESSMLPRLPVHPAEVPSTQHLQWQIEETQLLYSHLPI